ncbi:MAG TPA: NADH-quinone oxidoreductase subunit L [Ktedonobacterales bacterium]|nr:NADH-quinone oxidoreductase subunit L [Ktedonobacterales bacterium]
MLNLTPIILLLPLAGFVVLGLAGRWLPRTAISLIGCGVVLLAFACAVADFVAVVTTPAATAGHVPLPGVPLPNNLGDITLFNWVVSGSLNINFGLLSDPLSAVMLLIVTGVGFLIHVYSIGYMEGDPGYWRFFSFLNFFIFAMALLVAADNFLILLVGWAGVGLASFLLIGFWYTRPSAVAAAKKAFVVNVIGDFGLMLAIFLLFKTTGTLTFTRLLFGDASALGCAGLPLSAIPHSCPAVDASTFNAIALLLFVAAAAKSAQLPLQTWLPDAMEGPTPVSALIHAATMVTAGVYLLARAHTLFTAAPAALAVVAVVSGLTALYAASIACVQPDIKRVLAFSTMSQLAYMFMAESVGGFSTGIFHLTTHAYFKALLFMAAGAVIHALAGEQDMRKMGGLRERLPFTFWCFVISGLALAAIFPFAGFWSKDAILGVVLQHATVTGALGWYALWLAGLLTALLTGFYTFRLIFLTFLGEYRGPALAAHGTHAPGAVAVAPNGRGNGNGRRGRAEAREVDPLAHLHTPGRSMTVPMGILAVLSVIGGFVGTWLGDFLAPVTGSAQEPSGGLLWLGIVLSLAAGLLGIAFAWTRYGARTPSLAPSRNPLVLLLANRYYVDELYDAVIVRPLLALGRFFRRDVEGVALDGGSRALSGVVGLTSRGLRALQTGYARNYALAIFLGAALIVLYYVIRP